MPRPKKDFEPLNCKLDKEVAEKLTRFCDETGITKTKAVEHAIEKYVDEFFKTGKLMDVNIENDEK